MATRGLRRCMAALGVLAGAGHRPGGRRRQGEGRIFSGALCAAEGFLKSEAGKDFELKGEPVSDPLIGGNVGAAMRKGDPLLGEMNAAIKALRENGSYKAINDRYFAFDVFGS